MATWPIVACRQPRVPTLRKPQTGSLHPAKLTSNMRVLILGCGYVGLPLGRILAQQGHEVFGVRRDEAGAAELTAAGITPCTADVTRLEDLRKLPLPFDWIVNTVSSTRGGAAEYEQVYMQGMRNLIE